MHFGSKSREVTTFISINILVLCVTWLISVWRFQVSPNFIPLHYTIYFGFDRFGPKYDLFLFPVLGTIILATNIIIMRALFKNNRLWRGLILWLTILMELILLTSLTLALLKSL